MNQLTTIAALPSGGGCTSRLDPEVWKRAEECQWVPDWNTDCIVHKKTGQVVTGLDIMQDREKWEPVIEQLRPQVEAYFARFK